MTEGVAAPTGGDAGASSGTAPTGSTGGEATPSNQAAATPSSPSTEGTANSTVKGGAGDGTAGNEQTPATGQLGSEPAATPEQKIAQLLDQRVKVKINGKEQEVSIRELQGAFQMRSASNARFQDAAQMTQQNKNFIQNIKTDPMGGLKKFLEHPDMGLDMRKIATDYLVKQFEMDDMSPEARELHDAQQTIAGHEEANRARDAAETAAKNQQFEREYGARIQTEVIAAIKDSGLPVNEHSFDRMLYYLRAGADHGYDLNASQVIPLVKQDYQREIQAMTGGFDTKALMAFLGKEKLAEISAAQVANFKDGGNPAPATVTTDTVKAKAKEPGAKPETYQQLQERYRQEAIDERRKANARV